MIGHSPAGGREEGISESEERMATNTVPAAAPGPPDPPAQAPTGDTTGQPSKGFLAAMVAPVEPARPTLDPAPAGGVGETAPGPDGVLDRSAPGVSSASFRGAAEEAVKANDPTGARAKKSIWKEFWLAAATRWAKGGGVTNKRLDLAKARAQAKAHQVKENRTTTVAKSGGLPVRNTGGSGSGTNKGSDKSGGNSSGHNTNGAGPGGSGGGRGSAGGSANNGSGGGKGSGSSPKQSKGNHSADGAGGRGGRGNNGSSGTGSDSGKKSSGSTWSTDGKDGQGLAPAYGGKAGGKPDAKGSGHGPAGKGAGGSAGKAGAAGKDGAAGKTVSGTDSKGSKGSTDPKDSGKKVNLTKDPKSTKDPKPGDPSSKSTATAKGPQPAPQKTPLEKARETGHGDGTKARRVVDHVKAYKDGVVDGWDDEKTKNGKEHDRLDKAHDTHKPKTSPQPVIVTEQEDDGVTTDVKPLTVKTIDANTLTLDTAGGVRGTVGRRELRNFKQYERKLDAKVTVLQKISDACAKLQRQAEDESKDCQQLAEQAKGVKGGEKLVGKLDKLAEAAKNQAIEAGELAKRAARAAEMCKVVLTNIQTRYAPLYKAVVDSDETKPAELRFYNDKGTYAPAA